MRPERIETEDPQRAITNINWNPPPGNIMTGRLDGRGGFNRAFELKHGNEPNEVILRWQGSEFDDELDAEMPININAGEYRNQRKEDFYKVYANAFAKAVREFVNKEGTCQKIFAEPSAKHRFLPNA